MSRQRNAYDPELMAAVRDEEQYVNDQQHGKRQVKVERGQVWMVRFIPAMLGERKRWYARIARHWLNKKPIVCPVHTGEDYGGDKQAYCPCCEVADRLNASSDEDISKFGYKARGNSQWLTYCIVTDKDGNPVEGNELLMPYEFWHYTSTWEELKGFWKAGTRGGKNLFSVLDYQTGNDFAVSKTAKGLRLDKQDSTPIFDPADPNYDKYLDKIEAAIKTPKVKIPTERDLDIFAEKIQEEADRLSGAGRRPAARRVSPATDDPEGEEPEGGAEPAPGPRRPAPAPAAAAPRRRPAPTISEEEAPADPPEDDSNPELMPAPKKTAAPAAGPRRTLPAPVETEEAEQQEEAPAPRAVHTTAPKRRPQPVAEPEESGDPEPETEAEADGATDAPAPRRAPVAASRAPVAAGPKRASSIPNDHVEDDPEALPEEAADAAPPAKRGAEATNGDAETPTPVTRKTGLGSAIRAKVSATTARDE